jgi:predicted DNA-binding transcriptional regulator AlpA
MTERLLTPIEAGEMLAMSRGALAQLRYLGTGPRYVKLTGRAIRYRECDIAAWIEANLRSSTAPAGR